jgi:hypothetical protein
VAARVAYRGLRGSTIRPSKGDARDAEAELLGELKASATQAEQEGRPATLRRLFEFYVEDLQARGKCPETLATAVGTAHVVEQLMPELLDKTVTRISDRDSSP